MLVFIALQGGEHLLKAIVCLPVAKSRAKLGKEMRRRACELKREVFGSH
jgi:hypothetical protein